MKKLLLITILIIAMFGNVNSQIFPNPATLSTGQGAPGTIDPIWIVSPWFTSNPPNPMGLSYIGALINNNCAPGSWVNPAALPPPVNNGNWITGSDGAQCTGQGGYRYFRLTLNLPPDCNGNSVTTAGNYVLYFSGYADNTISNVFINGNSTGISGGNFAPGGQLNMTLAGPWVPGINYIDVLVHNFPGGSSNPYGLLLVANSTASSLSDGDNDGTTDINDQCPCQTGSKPNGCPASIVGDTIICMGESTTLTSTGVGTYLWNTGSTNVSITINPSVTTRYSVTVTTSTNAKDSAAVYVTVHQPPLISLTGDTMLCKGENTTLTATGGGTYFWNTGSTNNSITTSPSSTTNYKVVVTGTNGCKDSVNQSVTVFLKPAAGFTFTNQCNGTAVPFNSTSTINTPDVITNQQWDFGDTTTATGISPSHTYSHPGNFTVTLIINSNNSCADTVVHQITVFNNPIAAFTHSDVCYRDTMRFINTSTVNSPASISAYLWVFGDNSPISNLSSPAHYYSNNGFYTVTLVTTTVDGCSDVATISAKNFDAPNSIFAFTNTCLANSALFTNTSTNPTMGSTASWSWNFGDATPINTSAWSPQHLYATPGNYQVTLITHSSNLGCPDTMQSTITVFPMPSAGFSFTNVCLQQPMNFNDSSTVAGDSISGWVWNFADSSPLSSTQNTSHTYTSPNTYSVSLIATTNKGCKDTVIKSVVVHPLPDAQFSAVNVCDGDSVLFNNLSTIAAPDVLQSYIWNYGNGALPTTLTGFQTLSGVLYPAAGSYVVKLVTISAFGCRDSLTKTSTINPNPVANFTASDTAGCEPFCISFQNLSFIATGNLVQWLWNFGDGSPTSNLQSDVLHCYSNDSVFSPLSFTPTLTVTSDSGCITTTSKNNYITVYPSTHAYFSALPETTTITDPVISYTDLSTGAHFWNWNFGDISTASIQNPAAHTYADTGTYTITLITSTQYGCRDTAYQTIIIEPDFLFYIPNAFTPDGDGINDTFTGKGIFIKTFEMSIYDRWGNLIFFSDDIKTPWDGKANHGAEMAQRDVYVYVVKLSDFKNRKHNYKGIVTLVR